MAADRHGNGRRRSLVGCRAAPGSQLVPDGRTQQKAAPAGRSSCPRAQGAPPYAGSRLPRPRRPGGSPLSGGRRANRSPSGPLAHGRMTAWRQSPSCAQSPWTGSQFGSLLTTLRNPETGTWRVLRGGAWRHQAPPCKEATCPASALESCEGAEWVRAAGALSPLPLPHPGSVFTWGQQGDPPEKHGRSCGHGVHNQLSQTCPPNPSQQDAGLCGAETAPANRRSPALSHQVPLSSPVVQAPPRDPGSPP